MEIKFDEKNLREIERVPTLSGRKRTLRRTGKVIAGYESVKTKEVNIVLDPMYGDQLVPSIYTIEGEVATNGGSLRSLAYDRMMSAKEDEIFTYNRFKFRKLTQKELNKILRIEFKLGRSL